MCMYRVYTHYRVHWKMYNIYIILHIIGVVSFLYDLFHRITADYSGSGGIDDLLVHIIKHNKYRTHCKRNNKWILKKR